MKKGFLAKTFRGIALGLGIAAAAGAGQGCTLKSNFAMALMGYNPFVSVVSVKDALNAHSAPTRPTDLQSDQNKLTDLLQRAVKLETCRIVAEAAAGEDVYLSGWRDVSAQSNGTYLTFFKLALLNWGVFNHAIDGNASRESLIFSDEENLRDMTRALCHELAHSYQVQIWKNLYPPAGLNSFSKALWSIAAEAQAQLISDVDEQADGKGKDKINNQFLRNLYSQKLFYDNHVYYAEKDRVQSSYKLSDKSCDDGRFFTTEEFKGAFGLLPGRSGNFWENTLATEDIYVMLLSNPYTWNAAQKAGCQLPEITHVPSVS
jgi:hypothetical protein